MSVRAGMISDDELRLVVPLTPSRNIVDGWHATRNYKKLAAWRRAGQIGVKASLATLWPGGTPPRQPWADHIVISIIRCTDTNVAYDADNTNGGCKAAVDAMKKAGLIKDDTEQYVSWSGHIETRIKGQWGKLFGPATHLLVRRIPSLAELMEREAARLEAEQ